MKQYLPVVFILLGLSACAQSHKPDNSKPQRPNILFIMGDDHTSQVWGLYGSIFDDYAPNSNLKRMAANGAVLNNVFCTNSICSPSRATILTGQYSNRNGVYTLSHGLSPDSNNIAKELQKSGYQTAIFGKWHLREMPAGFDTFAVLPGLGVYFNPTFLTKENWNNETHRGTEAKGFSTDIITDMSINWMKKRDTTRPFLLMCHFKATHEPFEFAPRFKDLYKDVVFPYPPSFYDHGPQSTGRTFLGQRLEDLGKRYEQASTGKFWTTYPDLPFTTAGLDSMAARKKIYQKLIRDYMRSAAGINDDLGKILDYLKETGLDKNTVVIYTSDQGYFLGEHDFFDKRMMYEPSLRMPFVICYPKEIKGGTRIDDMILNTDFAALFADYAGIRKPAFVQGESFRKNLEGHTPGNWRKEMYYRYWQHGVDYPAHFGIRNERYKLIFFYGQPLGMKGTENKPTSPAWEFYDLKNDPHEMRNAIHDNTYKPVIEKMKKELLKLKEQAGDNDDAYPIMKKIISANW